MYDGTIKIVIPAKTVVKVTITGILTYSAFVVTAQALTPHIRDLTRKMNENLDKLAEENKKTD